MSNLTEWLTMAERAMAVAKIFEGQSAVIDTALNAVEKATHYTRIGLQLDEDMTQDVREASDLLQKLIDEKGQVDEAALDAQLARIQERSDAIAKKTAELKAQLDAG